MTLSKKNFTIYSKYSLQLLQIHFKHLFLFYMFYNKGSFLGNLFFPHRRDSVKKVVVLSAVTGVVSAAITNFFSKKENREKTRDKLSQLGEEARVARDRLYDKAQDVASDIADAVKAKANDLGRNIPNVDVKNSNATNNGKSGQKSTVTVDVDAKK